MLLSDFITKCRNSKAYFRGLVVRAIEDAIILFLGGAAIWSLCWVVGHAFNIMGVG